MPFLDLQTRLGFNLDRWLLLQSSEQPYKRAAYCHAFEKEYIECADGIGLIRAKKDCKLEMEDFYECLHKKKLHKRLATISNQRDKMVKEKSYVPPAHHTGQRDDKP
ncbi:hypothetical protein NHX12_023626 [Muraenolepis orangiensis]|uniref:NADH dehydrogenase [ubiquinone] iron-sulfur protein 5 n=1 Tax=Muraenolepis orangiensis TaxID=630683 RepID=A0A9Q0IS87_9TELE|nr:hypothetical protein NHX12_023626 [Muraenolepis orangiensis]